MFADQLAKFAEKAKENTKATMAEVIMGVAASLVDRSPVGDPTLWSPASLPPPKDYEGGRFKANWQGGAGEINLLVTDDIDPTGEISLASVKQAIPADPSLGIFYISNSLPYAGPLGDGWSTQAPPGFIVDGTVLDFQNIVHIAVLKVNS